LGVAEASFLSGMIVHLTHWFRLRERSRAIACFYAAVPAASLVGSPLAGWLLGVHWQGLAGWRWLFIVEGTPAVVIGIITIFYLTDWPAQARWLLRMSETGLSTNCEWNCKQKENSRLHDHGSVLRPAGSVRDCCLVFGSLGLSWEYLLDSDLREAPFGILGPSGDFAATAMLPALIGMAGTLINGWHSDKTGERRWHAAIPLLVAGLMYGFLIPARHDVSLAILLLLLASGFFYAYLPVCW
jgi:ACS family tartrate transporter-like MFS transporter